MNGVQAGSAVLEIPDAAIDQWRDLYDALAERGPTPCVESPLPDAWWTVALEASAIAECQRCPVARECLAYAIAAGERHGVWGGVTAEQRLELRRSA